MAETSSSAAAVPKAVTAAVTEEQTQKILAVRRLIMERDEARKTSQFALSDTLRDKLVNEFGVNIIDQTGGPSGWKFKDGSSKKLPSNVVMPVEAKRKRQETEEEPKSKKNKGENKEESKTRKEPIKSKKEQRAEKKEEKAGTLDERNRNAALVQALLGKAEGKGRTVQGVQIEELKVGTGKVARNGAKIKMCYVGKLKSNGKTFDACTSIARPFAFKLGKGEVIRGWDIGCEGMLVGGKRRLTIPPEKGYGQSGAPPTIPGNATLVFDVTLIDV